MSTDATNRTRAVYPVTVVGVGNMGGAMAQRLLSLGWPVAVDDIDPDRVQACVQAGALHHAPSQMPPPDRAFGAAHAVTIVCVVDAAQVEAALFASGRVQHLLPGHTVMLCPTIAPAQVIELAQRLGQSGLRCMDAPLSGGPARARAGTMSLMLACDDDLAARHADLLADLAGSLFRVGPRLGDAAATKLLNNLLAAANLAAAAEVLAAATRMGLDPSRLLQVIGASSGQSWIAMDRMPRALAGDLSPRAHMTLLDKDTRLALSALAASGLDPLVFTAVGAQAQALFAESVRSGHGSLDDAALYQHCLSRLPTISG